MKTFVKAREDYSNILLRKETYEVVKIFDTAYTSSGVSIVIRDEVENLIVLDSNFFE